MISHPTRNFNCDFQSRRPNCRASVPRAVFSTRPERVPHSAPFLPSSRRRFREKRTVLKFSLPYSVSNSSSMCYPLFLSRNQSGSFRRNTCFEGLLVRHLVRRSPGKDGSGPAKADSIAARGAGSLTFVASSRSGLPPVARSGLNRHPACSLRRCVPASRPRTSRNRSSASHHPSDILLRHRADPTPLRHPCPVRLSLSDIRKSTHLRAPSKTRFCRHHAVKWTLFIA